ncbi:hypothetical protein RIF29_06278 [Crotalaria pallida]|uniref:Uncharacterized protein n=1 Tax=Crotalaria pallida TaxID=3830 RepID=A0AAN9PA86_CROPI
MSPRCEAASFSVVGSGNERQTENSKYLSHLIFKGCEYIRQVPDVSCSPNLTELCIDYCTNLIAIHDSVGFLDKLQRFSAKGCTKLRIIPRHIKLTSLEYLCLRDCSDLIIFPEIVGPMEKLQFVDLEGTAIENLPPSMQNLGGLQSLSLNRCTKLNVDALSNIFQMLPFASPYLSRLSLDDSNLTMIPECIQECSFLKTLSVENCKQLQEFRGLPQNIERVNASNCPSMNIHCSTSKMSLKRIFQPASTRGRLFRLTGDRLPEWFDISNPGNSVGFWFRNGIPDITVAAVTGGEERSFVYFFTINYNFRQFGFMFRSMSCYGPDEILICNNFREILSSCSALRLHDGWNYAEVLFYEDYVSVKSVRQCGVYINREYTSMENIRFTNPYYLKTTSDDSSFSNQHTLPGNGLNDTPHIDHVHCNADSVESEKTIHDSNVLRRKPFALSLWLLLTLVVVLSSTMWPFCFYHNFTQTSTDSKLDQAVLDHLKMAPGESFQGQGSKKENIQTRGPTLSSDKVNEAELNLKRCRTDESFRYQVEQVQDDVEMEAFYASLDGGTRVPSCFRDESVTTVSSEESKEALKIVRDFISNDASIFLRAEKCSVMQASLDFLSNLSEDDAISDEMMTLISEASRKFTHWTNDYIEASMKIESISSELLIADELEAALEDNKKQFREVVALENELLQKLGNNMKVTGMIIADRQDFQLKNPILLWHAV